MSANQIVQVNVSQTIAPTPNRLQQTGIIVTQGGTNTLAGTVTLIATQAQLSAILGTPGTPATKLQAAFNTFTANNAAGRAIYVLELGSGATSGYVVGGVLSGTALAVSTWTAITAGSMAITIDGVVKTLSAINFSTGVNTLTDVAAKITTALGASGSCAWNGSSFVITSATTGATSTVSYASATGSGTDISALAGLVTGVASVPVPGYVAGTAAGISALQLFIASNPKKYYAYLLPDGWSADSTLLGFVNLYTGTTQEIYFYFHATAVTYGIYAAKKSVVMAIQAAAAPSTEFTVAAWFAGVLQYDPSATNQVTPFAFRFLFGVTAYPISSVDAINFKAGNLNFVDTGAEGGISNTIAKWGVTADGRDITYWYSVDWSQINLELDLANAIINGSNNPLAPLYYNQSGINRLLAVAQGTMNRAITYGLALSPVTVTAIDFLTYTTANPSDYSLGKYTGLACSYVPARGFTNIIFNLNVTDFVTG